jgi:hypothetical protein
MDDATVSSASLISFGWYSAHTLACRRTLTETEARGEESLCRRGVFLKASG